jgi:hypothetical protein
MHVQVLRGSKQEIAEGVARIQGDVREAIVFVEEPAAATEEGGADIFAEMEPYMVNVGDADDSREALYSRVEGE